MKLRNVILRLLGREVAKPEIEERADRVLEEVDRLQITVVPKRDLRELRRLDSLARRR